jgi:hypothetical protein
MVSNNGRTLQAYQVPSQMPSELNAFLEPSPVLPDEDLKDYEFIKQMMIDDVSPQTNMEWLWTLDLVELSWEIIRYRRLKQKVLEVYREAAIQSVLQRLDGAGMPAGAADNVHMQTKRNAEQWRSDRGAADEIEARLARHGFDLTSITAEVFVQARDVFDMFDGLMQSAQSRRLMLLREINIRREITKRVKSLRSFN